MLRIQKLITAFVFTSLLFFVHEETQGQQLVYKFRQYTTNDGLPSSEVHQVLRDSRNFMWFATDHGVCRYDGYKFETFNLPDNSILSIYEDSKKRIWFASFSGQLFYYENGKFNNYKYNDIVVKMIEQSAINRFYVDSNENVYVSSTIPDCFVIDSKGGMKRLFRPNVDWVNEAFQINNGMYFTYLSGSPTTIFSLIPPFTRINTIVAIKSKGKNYKIQIPYSINGRKKGIYKLRDGSLIFYSAEYLIKILQNGKYIIKKLSNEILDIKELENGNILVATIQDGLYILNSNNEILENYFSGLTVTSIEKDYEEGTWISTTQAGVFYLNSFQIRHLGDGKVIINKKMLHIAISGRSDIWVGGESGSLIHFQIRGKLEQYDFPIISINSIYFGITKNAIAICVGTFTSGNNNKLVEYKIRDKRFFAVQSNSDLISFKGEIFSGSQIGIRKINFSNKTLETQNKEHFRILSLFASSKGEILIGNLFGLWRFVDGNLHPYDSTKKILSSRITDINEYQKKYLCLGTRGKGFLFLINDSLYQITQTNGLASDNIRKIFIDENIIWLATNRGLSQLTVESLNPFKYSIKNISVSDGLLSNEVNDIKRLDSNIIVATNGGISVFKRNSFSSDKPLPLSLYITDVKINGHDTAISTHYDLHYRDRNLSISFVALSYRENSNIEYRYRLTGINSDWTYSANKEIQLNPMPYGEYTVQIQARRQGENWRNENNLSLTINRRLPFWKTIWFLIICFLFVSILMLLFFIDRTRRIKRREKERTLLNKKLADMEMKALRAQMNPHFIFNVLNSIQYYITHNENEEAQRYMSKFAKLVRMILDNSRSTFIALGDELSLLKLYIDLEKIRFEDRFDYAIRIDDSIDAGIIKIPNMLLQPYVENSIKHGFKDKTLKYFLDISITRQNENIVCVIEDNGIGRSKAALIPGAEKEQHVSTGTIIIKEKIDALKTYYNYFLTSETTDLKDEKGNLMGTRVTLTFPERFEITDMI